MVEPKFVEMINAKNHDVYIAPDDVEAWREKGYMVIGVECNVAKDGKGKKIAVPLPVSPFPQAAKAAAPVKEEVVDTETEELIQRVKGCTVKELEELIEEIGIEINLGDYSNKAEKVKAIIAVLEN